VTNNTQAFGTGAYQVVAGAFEVYWVDRCSQLAGPGVSFGNVLVQDINGNILSPAAMHWVDNDWIAWPGGVPECWTTATHVANQNLTTANINWSLCGAPPLSAIESLLLR
jgi:hypothetical protein